MRISPHRLVRQPDLLQQLRHPALALVPRYPRPRTNLRRRSRRPAYAGSASRPDPGRQWAGAGAEGARTRRAAPSDRSRQNGHARGGTQQLQDGLAGRGLATTRLTDQGQGAAAGDGQRHAIHGPYVTHGPLQDTAADRKVHVQVADVQQRQRGRRRRPTASGARVRAR